MLTNEYLVISEHRRLNQKVSQIEPIRTDLIKHTQPKNPSCFINEARRLLSNLTTRLGKGIGFEFRENRIANHQLPLGITTLESGKAYDLRAHSYLTVVSGNLLITRDGLDMVLRTGCSLPISSSNHRVLALVLGKTETTVELRWSMPDNSQK
jgi:hypothetical protein